MDETQPQVEEDASYRDPLDQEGLISFTIFWKENPSVPLVRIRTIHATDLETAKEAAHFLIFEESSTVAVVLAVVEDQVPCSERKSLFPHRQHVPANDRRQ